MKVARRYRQVVGVAAVVLCAVGIASGAGAAPAPLRIDTVQAGLHKITWEDLAGVSGLPDLSRLTGPVRSSGLGLENRGTPVPIWVEDGRDGAFGPGDWLEFVAEVLPGTFGAFHEYSRTNVYVLAFDAQDPARMRPLEGVRGPGPERWPTALEGRVHREQDELLMRFSCDRASAHELWYWSKLSCIDPEPFVVTLDLPDLDLRSEGRVTLEVDVHGWSHRGQADDDVADHELEIRLNERLLSRQGWNGGDAWRVTLEGIPAGRWRRGANELSFGVPLRDHPETGDLVVDVTVLNWISLRYPQQPQVDHTVLDRFSAIPADFPADAPIVLVSPAGGATGGAGGKGSTRPSRNRAAPVLYRNDGVRIAFPATAGENATAPTIPRGGADGRRVASPGAAGENATALTFPRGAADGFRVVWPDGLAPPAAVVPFVTAGLRTTGRQADYLVIAHPSLREAVEPLVDYRRSQGLTVEVVDIQTVYDAFNDGIVHPSAVRDFIRYAYHEWRRPAPRFVLLVGDASWDTKHDELRIENYAFKPKPLQSGGVGRWEGPTYRDAGRLERGLIPTWTYVSRKGHSASDNAFACVDGDDNLPDLAIGRLPVVHPRDVRAIVNKTIAYERSAGFGPWRRNTLWITNEQEFFQRSTDSVAQAVADDGFVVRRVYPERGEGASADRILEAWDEGQFLVSFYGHGGRNIWRTSPADVKGAQDLFTLSHLDRLTRRAALPVVLSFTCYSAPFDHPLEDSIGEKLIRLAETGAVAVVAASWRNSPGLAMRRRFVDAFTREATAGEALVVAKRQMTQRDAIEMYNLLGDPALALDAPARSIDLRHTVAGDVHTIRGALEDLGPDATALVEWLNADGAVVRSRRIPVVAGEWRDAYPVTAGAATPAAVRSYAWDEGRGRSAVGAVAIQDAIDVDTPPAAAQRSEGDPPEGG